MYLIILILHNKLDLVRLFLQFMEPFNLVIHCREWKFVNFMLLSLETNCCMTKIVMRLKEINFSYLKICCFYFSFCSFSLDFFPIQIDYIEICKATSDLQSMNYVWLSLEQKQKASCFCFVSKFYPCWNQI